MSCLIGHWWPPDGRGYPCFRQTHIWQINLMNHWEYMRIWDIANEISRWLGKWTWVFVLYRFLQHLEASKVGVNHVNGGNKTDQQLHEFKPISEDSRAISTSFDAWMCIKSKQWSGMYRAMLHSKSPELFLVGFWYFHADIFGDFLLGMRLLEFFGWFVGALVTCHCRGTPAWHMSQPPGEWCCVACAKKDADQFCTFL